MDTLDTGLTIGMIVLYFIGYWRGKNGLHWWPPVIWWRKRF